LINLETMVNAEKDTLARLENQKTETEQEIQDAEEALEGLHSEMKRLEETLEEETKAVDRVKATSSKASKVLEQSLKEIALRVSSFRILAYRLLL
jgi:structural maintenance of chromosome 1